MLAAEAVVDAKPAAASAALPETKVRLFKISSLARAPSGRGESGATAHRIYTGNVADLPVRACYGKPQLYLMNDEETRETPAFPPRRARRCDHSAGGQSVAARPGGLPAAGLGPVLRGRQQVGGGRRHRLQRGREGGPRRHHRPDGQYRPA